MRGLIAIVACMASVSMATFRHNFPFWLCANIFLDRNVAPYVRDAQTGMLTFNASFLQHPTDAPQAYVDLAMHCLSVDPKARPSLSTSGFV